MQPKAVTRQSDSENFSFPNYIVPPNTTAFLVRLATNISLDDQSPFFADFATGERALISLDMIE